MRGADMTSSSQTLPDVGDGSRLYQQLARRLLADLAGGRYAVGDRLPPERELAIEHDVSRPTVREYPEAHDLTPADDAADVARA